MPESGFSLDRFLPKKAPSEKAVLPLALEQEYLIHREKIKDTYKNVWVWHGTGRFDQRGGQTVDILNEIVSPGSDSKPRGLVPHTDTWAGSTRETISATKTRPYAALYSDIHFVQGAEELVFKDKRKLKMLSRRMLPHAVSFLRDLPNILKQKQVAKKWLEEKTGQKVEGSIWRAAWKFGSRRSSISGDYPILVAFKQNAFEPISLPGYIAATEVRTDKSIPVEKINHIEVPLKNVEETLRLLKEKGIYLDLIPREFGERYSSEFTDEEVLSGDGFARAA